ncbi:MAG: hypothetical protein KatS3mg060_2324 [Dehalococcoidia bacterium]|nr:MAG: hypothetical protein KatS3mg060_2324 [Dehalococcoidia bacterium]
MSATDLLVIAAGLGLMVFLLWFFFGPKQGRAAAVRAGVQEATIRVEGAYQPNRITVKAGMPVRLKFDRREATDCSNRVVLPDFGISRALPAFATTAVEFTPERPGEYPFACAMNMYRGTLVVEPDGRAPGPEAAAAAPTQTPSEVAPRPSAEERPARAEFRIRGQRSITTVTALEDLLGRLPGVERVQVNAATERATVDYIPGLVSPEQLADAIRRAGYTAEPTTAEQELADRGVPSRESEVADIARRFVVAVVLTLPLLVGAMWHLVLPMPPGPLGDLVGLLANPFVQLVLATPVLFYSGWGFFRGTYFTLKNRTADMNTLIGIGTGAAYLYSLAATFFGDWLRRQGIEAGVYYETAAVIVSLILLGRLLEARAKAGTSAAIQQAAVGLQAKTARVRRDGRELDVPVEEVRVGDLVVVRPGEKDPGRRRHPRGRERPSTSHGHRRERARRQGAGRHGDRRHDQQAGAFVFEATKVGAGYGARPDHPARPGGAGLEGADPAARRRRLRRTSCPR